VIAVWTTAVAYDVDIIGGSERCDTQEFGEASAPHDIRLDDVNRFGVQKFLEAVSGIFVLK
jgi:hypothetical protein